MKTTKYCNIRSAWANVAPHRFVCVLQKFYFWLQSYSCEKLTMLITNCIFNTHFPTQNTFNKTTNTDYFSWIIANDDSLMNIIMTKILTLERQTHTERHRKTTKFYKYMFLHINVSTPCTTKINIKLEPINNIWAQTLLASCMLSSATYYTHTVPLYAQRRCILATMMQNKSLNSPLIYFYYDFCFSMYIFISIHSRDKCFTTAYFKGCLDALQLTDEVEIIKNNVKQLNGAQPPILRH